MALSLSLSHLFGIIEVVINQMALTFLLHHKTIGDRYFQHRWHEFNVCIVHILTIDGRMEGHLQIGIILIDDGTFWWWNKHRAARLYRSIFPGFSILPIGIGFFAPETEQLKIANTTPTAARTKRISLPPDWNSQIAPRVEHLLNRGNGCVQNCWSHGV